LAFAYKEKEKENNSLRKEIEILNENIKEMKDQQEKNARNKELLKDKDKMIMKLK